MKIELKNIKYAAFASQETSCYEGVLLVDGKPLAIVSNEGHGGCDMQYKHPKFAGDIAAFRQKMSEINDWLKANIPADTSHGITLEYDIELYCGKLLDEFLLCKDMKRAMKKAAMVKMSDGKVYEFKPSNKAAPSPGFFAAIKAKHPDAVIMNELPENDALAIYKTIGNAA